MRSRRWPSGGGLLLAFTLGALAGLSVIPALGRALGAWVRDPRAALEAHKMRQSVFSLAIDVGFSDYKRWMDVEAQIQDTGHVPGAMNCVTVQVDGSGNPLAASLCPIEAPYSPTPSPKPAFSLEATTDAQLLGADRVRLVPADPSSALGLGYLRTLADGGVAVPLVQIVEVRVNGSSWGLYVLAADAASLTVPAGGVLVTFDAAALPTLAPTTPDRSFAFAQTVVQPLEGVTASLEEAARLVSMLASGAVSPSTVLDPDTLGRMIAATALWHGVHALDWRTLDLVYDPLSGGLDPVPAGWTPDPETPLPAAFTGDPEVQRAIALWLMRYSDPAVTEVALTSGELEALHVALEEEPGRLRSLLMEHQTAMRAAVTPSRTLFASIAEEPRDVRIDLRAIVPFPIELLSLDLEGQGTVALDPAWVPSESAALRVVEGTRIVLSARTGAEPVVASLTVPMTALPSAWRLGQGTLSLVTRVWGLETSIPVTVDAARAWEVP